MNNLEIYLRKIIEMGCNPSQYDNLIIYSNKLNKTVKETLLKLKSEYGIKDLTFMEYDYQKLYNLFRTNPKKEEIEKMVIQYPKINDSSKTKLIYDSQMNLDEYYMKILDVFDYSFGLYKNKDIEKNAEYYNLFDNRQNIIAVALPHENFAKRLLGSSDRFDELCSIFNQVIPSSNQYQEEVKKLKEIRKYLTMLKIKNLYFHTDVGTDFKISLTKHSIWLSEPECKNNQEFFFNFPSYEIYTSPNCYSAEGNVVLTKPSSLYGQRIENVNLEFVKGKCVKVDCDNNNFANIIMDKENNMYRIGEIALVSKDTPLAKLNRFFDLILFDENAGCHLALGDSIRECVNIPDDIINKKGLRYFRYNESSFHQDLIFGNDSINVEASTSNKQKVLLLENGLWKF